MSFELVLRSSFRTTSEMGIKLLLLKPRAKVLDRVNSRIRVYGLHLEVGIRVKFEKGLWGCREEEGLGSYSGTKFGTRLTDHA